MPDMRSAGKKGKKKPKMMQASFQAGESSSAAAAQTATMEVETQMIFDQSASSSTQVASTTLLAAENGFEIQMTLEGDDDASNHFSSMRKKDKAAYEKRQAEVQNKFGFEQASFEPKAQSTTTSTAPQMVSSSTGYDSEEEKANLVKRLKAMEAEEEHDNLFDKPVPFGLGAPD